VISIHSNHLAARAALIACSLDLGLYREAALQARLAISFDWQRRAFQGALATADSALRVNAPAGTVRLTVSATDSLGAYVAVGRKK
jgi:hypothetical protein